MKANPFNSAVTNSTRSSRQFGWSARPLRVARGRLLTARTRSDVRGRLISLLCSLALLAGLCAPLLDSRPAAAAPALEPAAGGTFVVNTVSDGNVPDYFLSLREAILLANGGTMPNGLNRFLTAAEQAQLTGCTVSGGLIVGGCGLGYADDIVFTGLAPEASLYISSELPAVDDDLARTKIDGSVGDRFPTIRRDPSLNSYYIGLLITSSNNVIRGIGVEGDACGNACGMFTGFQIHGNHNHLANVWAWKAFNTGILVWSGTNNLIEYARIGVAAPTDLACFPGLPTYKGNTQYGVVFSDISSYNAVRRSWIGCNGNTGVWAYGHNNSIGPDNFIGTNSAGTGLLGNAGDGVYLYGDSNIVYDNTIAFNGDQGIDAVGANNKIGGNAIRGNAKNGVRLFGAAQGNLVGGPQPGLDFGGNTITGNGQHGLALVVVGNVSPHDNKIAGNWIGTTNGQSAAPNAGEGILLEGAYNNAIGLPDAAANVIRFNGQNGIRLDSGAHDNILTGGEVANNTLAGIRFAGANTANNVVAQVYLHHNGIHGIHEVNGAANNWWTQISSHDNGSDGINKQTAMVVPTLASANILNGQVTVQGTASAGSWFTTYTVEVYKASGDGEGLQYMGSANTNGSGAWSVTFSGAPGCYTAFQTWYSSLGGTRASSKFATTYCVQAGQQGYTIYVPIAVRP